MSIAALGPTYISEDETTRYTSPKDVLGRDQFLTLLVAQLQHQDPLNPLESTEFTAQLAQFSSLEQLFSINENLMNIQEGIRSQEYGDILGYIGKTVKTTDNTIQVSNGTMESGSYTLEDRADVAVFIYDGDGMEVRRLYPGWQDPGEHALAWDGKDNAGDKVADGTYTFEIEARNERGAIVPYSTYLTGEVTGVTYQGGIPYLMIGDQLVTPENIVEVTKTVAGQ
ncbi:MAG: flagellar hook assembly protein FlgD [Deltaproteobacteria bacterium]|nr:flagellar hook assembly protein FlgD [Deltaproteobacteria bacterium]MBW2018959.1 flagellar hook assembly protein FlgD [Deltaproteobacteria bacterium]MBW2073174.1 flagellar hook assembly protein FlgD [Deltaproteobacteria bacterium]